MHTVKVIVAGFALLAGCLLVARWIGGPAPSSWVLGAKVFIPLWLIGAGINLWLGVARAGYTVADEAPIFVVVFATPAAMALLVWWRFSQG